jgi:plasmid stabilization system protein ParE
MIWAPEALDDIDRLWDYYAEVARRASADKLLRQIAKVVAAIDEFRFREDYVTISEPSFDRYPRVRTSYFIV